MFIRCSTLNFSRLLSSKKNINKQLMNFRHRPRISSCFTRITSSTFIYHFIENRFVKCRKRFSRESKEKTRFDIVLSMSGLLSSEFIKFHNSVRVDFPHTKTRETIGSRVIRVKVVFFIMSLVDRQGLEKFFNHSK